MNTNPLSAELYYALMAACVLLAVGLMVWAWQRPRLRQRALRVVATGVAVGALWLTAFPPRRAVPSRRAEAILLTEGYNADTLRALRRRLGEATPLWVYGDSALTAATAPARARPLASLLTLAEQQPALRRLHVLGNGPGAAEWPLLSKVPVQAYSGTSVAGFQAASWPAKLSLGDVLHVEGKVSLQKEEASSWVALRAAGALRDSVRLPAGGGAFRLRYQPRTTGFAQYELVLRRAGKPVLTEPVPVEIQAATLPAVLLLAATPSFEFKFLKNYLAEAHYAAALRTTVSRNLVQTEFVNQTARTLNRLTPALLAQYQVVVADAATLAGLSGSETQALQAGVRAGRMGLVVLGDAAPLPRNVPARADFTVLPRAAAVQTTPQPLTWPDAPAAVQAATPAQLRAVPALRGLVAGPNQTLLAASRRVGLGFVVVSVVPETFRWALQGRTLVYASFWTRLLRAVVPPAPAAATWRVAESRPRPHQPLSLQLTGVVPLTSPTVSPVGGGTATRLALRQDTRLPEWSSAQFWPATAGWHAVRGPGAAVHHFYVYPTGAWSGIERQLQQQAAAEHHQPATVMSDAAVEVTYVPWPAAWFFALFLLAAGYLWLEEKL